MAINTSQVILGSGDLYIMPFTPGAIPANNLIEVATNQIGAILGGATITDAPEVYEIIDDKGRCLKRFITKHDITFKSGLLTWDLESLNTLSLGGKITKAGNLTTLKIGTSGAIGQFLVRFVHTKADGKKLRVTIVGTASNGFELAFASDKETVIDAEFKAMAHDSEGNQIIFEEETGV